MPQKLKAKLILVGLASDNPDQTRDSLEKLLGIEFIRTLEQGNTSYHAPVDEDGIDIQVGPRRGGQDSTTFYFQVDNLDTALQQVGGRVVWGPQTMDMSDQAFPLYEDAMKQLEPGTKTSKQMGRAAAVVLPGGATIGLMELADHMHSYYKAGKDQKPIDDKRLAFHNRSKEAAAKLHGSHR